MRTKSERCPICKKIVCTINTATGDIMSASRRAYQRNGIWYCCEEKLKEQGDEK